MNHRAKGKRFRQRGVASIVALLFLIAAVVFVLGQTITMSGSKSSDRILQSDSIRALYVAESGLEYANSNLISQADSDDTILKAACEALPLLNPIALGAGQYQFLATDIPATNTLCKTRVAAEVSKSRRVLEQNLKVAYESGVAGYGTSISMRLKNKSNVGAVGLFNLAWRRSGSTGHPEAPGGQGAVATGCSLPGCDFEWRLESSSGIPSVGSLGVSVEIPAKQSYEVVQKLDKDRNYAQVGTLIPGFETAPVIRGTYWSSTNTTNNSASGVYTGQTTSGAATDQLLDTASASNCVTDPTQPSQSCFNWCRKSDTLVFGVSGRAADQISATFTSVNFDSQGTDPQNAAMRLIAHYPNIDGSTPDTYGDIFSEIYYLHNPYFLSSGASSEGGTITVPSTAGLQPGTILKVVAGTGRLLPNSRVRRILNDTQFEIYISDPSIPVTPASALSGATICGGICAFFQGSLTTTTSTYFRITASLVTQWAGGFTCLSGANPDGIRKLVGSKFTLQNWREVISDE
jgi:hypothetical protein